jgi:sugar-specific transcriptional regulator TrmB
MGIIMNDQLATQLEELGLSEKEARVYLASLAVGAAGVQKLADHSGIKRVTTYVILESLINLGLISQSTKGKKTLYIAEQPSSLKRLLDKKEQAIKDQKLQFDDLLPQLLSLQNQSPDVPNVRFYEGVEGVRSIVSNFISQNGTDTIHSYGISNIDQIYAFFPEFKNAGGNPDRIKSNVFSSILYTSKSGPVLKSTDHSLNRESRYIPFEEYPINGDLTILGDNVVLLSLSGKKPIGVTIQSPEIARMMEAIFKLAWERAEKYNAKPSS